VLHLFALLSGLLIKESEVEVFVVIRSQIVSVHKHDSELLMVRMLAER
jgi:hypothetical protein